MAADDFAALFGRVFEQAAARRYGLIHVAIVFEMPVRMGALGAGVQRVAGNDRLRPVAGEPYRDVARRVARCGDQRYLVAKFVAVSDHFCLPRCNHWQDAFLVGDAAAFREGFVVGLWQKIFGIGKRRNPSTIGQFGIPADMVDVQVGAQDEIDVIWCDTCSQKRGHKAGVCALMPIRVVGGRLVVANTSIDEDHTAGGLQKKALHGKDQLARGRVDGPRCERLDPRRDICASVRKKFFRCEKRRMNIKNAPDFDVADFAKHIEPFSHGLPSWVTLPAAQGWSTSHLLRV
jgi:hypothetical protein